SGSNCLGRKGRCMRIRPRLGRKRLPLLISNESRCPRLHICAHRTHIFDARAAEKFASKRLLQFSEGLLKEMNARVHILIAFENSKGKPVAFDFELSGGNAGARGQAFRDLYDAQLKEMGLLELWKDFAAD